MAIAPVLALDAYHRPALIGIDFHTYAAAAVVGLAQGWSRIYDQGVVAAAQHALVPTERTQPYLSPPPVAWAVAPLQALPYWVAFDLWFLLMLGAVVFALAWSTTYRGAARVAAVGVALAPWWVAQAVMVGQVVPLVAASLVIAWRLLRDDRDVAAGLVLALVMLKPNTAILAPVALLCAGRVRAFAAWLTASAVIVGASLLTLGPHGMEAYIGGLTHLPSGANYLTLSGTFGLTGITATAVRLAIVAAAVITAFRLRHQPGVALALGALASLLVAPYLHASDLCVLVAAGWIIWHERPDPFLRALMTIGLVMATPLDVMAGLGPPLDRWLVFELALATALTVIVWLRAAGPAHVPGLLTEQADFGKHAPA